MAADGHHIDKSAAGTARPITLGFPLPLATCH